MPKNIAGTFWSSKILCPLKIFGNLKGLLRFCSENLISQYRKTSQRVPFNVLQNAALLVKAGNERKIYRSAGRFEVRRMSYEKLMVTP